MVMNDTKVVRARIHLERETGGRVEALLLDPLEPSTDPAITLAAQGECSWRCMVGGLKKLRNGGAVTARFPVPGREEEGNLQARYLAEDADGAILRFQWSPADQAFSEVLGVVGHIPLPPYIKREDQPVDAEDYQTVYAEREGAVAAPTAGLHFTPKVLEQLQRRDVETLRLTLHVGAGTFAPVKSERAAGHLMHEERIGLSREALIRLMEFAERREKENLPLVHVGTTTLRTMESLYWFGVGLLRKTIDREIPEIRLGQWDAWRLAKEGGALPDLREGLEELLAWSDRIGLEQVGGTTRLMILPGHPIRTCDGLITNFHQPGSTLILLTAAFLGGELWREVYRTALAEGYRFLSYGDSSLLVRSRFPQGNSSVFPS